MPYGQFDRIEQVADAFTIKVTRTSFIDLLPVAIDKYFLARMGRALLNDVNFVNEYAIRQHIITPMLDIVADNYEELEVWSEVSFNVNSKLKLEGKPDYLIAPYADNGGVATPPLCIIEAKEKDWKKGWAQAFVEMYAASTQGANICYGVVTTGEFWQFARLEESIFTRDPVKLSAIENLQKVLDTLNWLFKKTGEQVQAMGERGT